MHPLEDPRDPLKAQYNTLKTLLGPPDFGLRDLWLSESYHPRSNQYSGRRGSNNFVGDIDEAMVCKL